MDQRTYVLAEMTNPQVEAFLARSQTVIVPVGSLEQHGPHGPLGTDAFVPTEVARRICAQVDAAIAPTVPYSLSYPHKGFTGVVFLRMSTFAALIEDLCAQLSAMGFRRIVFLNGHYDNTYAIAYACAAAADSGRMAEGTRAFPVNYWDGMTVDEASQFFDAASGLHANKGEMSEVMAINPDWVDLDNSNAEMPPFPDVTSPAAVHTAFFFSTPGSVFRATQSGTWGDAREASAEFGERYLAVVSRATVRLLSDINKTFEAMPPR
jgi:creatinine amidohydrolase